MTEANVTNSQYELDFLTADEAAKQYCFSVGVRSGPTCRPASSNCCPSASHTIASLVMSVRELTGARAQQGCSEAPRRLVLRPLVCHLAGPPLAHVQMQAATPPVPEDLPRLAFAFCPAHLAQGRRAWPRPRCAR